ncbi:thioredoxin family protein [Yoonia maritima]|uniref:thioredoxin family protein n=1 Tax=Yoonia maritima TaxID=1435347 RepID=UPI0037366AB0
MPETVVLTCLACGQGNRVPAEKLNSGPKCAKCGAPMFAANVAELDLKVHDKARRTDQLPLLIDYWAEWCGPCKMMAPEFAKAAQAIKPRARFAKVNTEQYPEISSRLNIRGIPLLILYANGREVARLSGARPAADIEGFVRQHL